MTSMDLYKKLVPVCLMIVFVLICVLFLIFPPNGKLICKANGVPGEVEFEYSYIADYKLWFVKHLTVIEKISSENDESLNTYKEVLENDYQLFNKVKSVDSNIEMIDTSLVGTFKVDYEKLNEEDYKIIGSTMKYKNIFVGKLKRIYKKNGATCHYE